MKRLLILGIALAGLAAVLPGAALAEKPKAAGPSFNVLGFGINQAFVAKGTTVKTERQCDDIVGADSPVGPPQQIYLTVYVKAAGIPKKAKVQFKDSFPYGYDDVSTPTLSDPVPFSRLYGVGGLIGAPEDTRELYYEPIVSFNSENGPSAEEFNGEYSYSAQTEVGGHLLRSTAKVKIDCPMLR
jgi:hypothetical protein